jgi:hypothetical protein
MDESIQAMKLLFLTSTSLLLLSFSAHAQPIDVLLPESVTIEKPVMVIQPVTVSAVQISRISIDTTTRQIAFQLTGGNQTVSLSGPAYDAIAASFTLQFAQSIAPLIEEHLRAGGSSSGE